MNATSTLPPGMSTPGASSSLSSHTPSPHQSYPYPYQSTSTSYNSSRPSTSSLPRSYKRAKNTPSPNSPVRSGLPTSFGSSLGSGVGSSGEGGGVASSTKSRTRANVARRLVEASPQHWKFEGRRREMSVPLLSQELSHFSLSRSSPPEMLSQQHSSQTPPMPTETPLDPSSRPSRTPRSKSHFGPERTPFTAGLPKDHTYPSTAPLPHLSSFLGSPFSSKTARGRYVYHNTNYSPSVEAASAAKGAMTEQLNSSQGQGTFDQQDLEWLESNDGLPRLRRDGALDEDKPLPEGLPQSSCRIRRGTNGSTSSMDELSGSGASTASLLSLARNSIEHQSRPNIITAWDEEPSYTGTEEHEHPTPSRQLFSKPPPEHGLHISKKFGRACTLPKPDDSRTSDLQSPLPRSQNARLLNSFILPDSTPTIDSKISKNLATAPSTEKTGRSPLSTFLPRLLSSKKKTSSMREQVMQRVGSGQEAAEDEDSMTDTEESSSRTGTLRGRCKSGPNRPKLSNSWNPMEGGDHEPSAGLGIGLGIRRGPLESLIRGSADKSVDLARSLSSDSSGDIDVSPSRPLSTKGSTSMFVKPSMPFSPTSSALANQSKSAFHVRRKSTTTNTLHKPFVPGVGAGTTSPISHAGRPPKARPLLRRGITAPAETPYNAAFLSADAAFHTPTAVLFGDVKPSPAAFASTGLVKKKSSIHGVEIPKFGAGIDSEPIGERKRDRAAAQHGMSRTIDPPSPVSPIKTMKLTRPSLNTCFTGTTLVSTSTNGSNSNSTSTTNSNAAYIQNAQRTRGLRRKGSQMFTASGSIGSIDMLRSDSNRSARGGASPATPTKPGLQLTPIGLGITTPSPTSHHVMYPFASSSALLSTPPHSDPPAPDSVEPSSVERYRGLPARVRQISNSHMAGIRGPIARASNPMLAASFKASIHVVPETPGPGQSPAMSKDDGDNGVFGIGSARYGHVKRGATTRLDKDFTVIETLGSGAFSQVLKVREKASGRLYAVKAGKPYTGAKNRLRQLEEVSILRQLSLNPHPNVVEYVDSWETHSRLYIRTALAECGDLSKFLGLLGDYGGLGEARVWKTLVELGSGIAHIHKHNFLHLDIKSSNILINPDGGLVIADLGMAVICAPDAEGRILGGFSPALPEKDEQGGFIWTSTANISSATGNTISTAATAEEGEAEASTTSGIDADAQRMDVIPSPILDREIEGDREYLCPEALGDGEIGKGADVYSLGMVLLEAAMNVVLPSNGEGWVKLRNDDFSDLEEHYRVRPRSQSQQATGAGSNMLFVGDNSGDPATPQISDELLAVIKHTMRSDPSDRWGLDDIFENRVVKNVLGGTRGRALVEESDEWLDGVLA
ncbi:WEE protein kinase [Kwoniella heveanensis CBS 569]|nr:WEE protein kinase [Kwoniella heveanensis CBS 569]